MENKVTHTRIEKETLELLRKVAKAEERTMIIALRKAIEGYAKKQGVKNEND